ncbi:hypothetical protein AVEN_162815-1 [Araneus ventricosus]|uniref:Uncharacterized protein n=1 Tax=Araneus ventricosus TaxID=182803 RepID=A0A4Y2C5R8_ARAVE|nr:hypothetical protein AVEN_162815-1 [Araneus ventricosus]
MYLYFGHINVSPVSSQLKTCWGCIHWLLSEKVRKKFEIILSCLHPLLLTTPDNEVNAGPFSKVSNQPDLALNEVFRCLVRGVAGSVQQITVNRSCLLAYDALC